MKNGNIKGAIIEVLNHLAHIKTNDPAMSKDVPSIENHQDYYASDNNSPIDHTKGFLAWLVFLATVCLTLPMTKKKAQYLAKRLEASLPEYMTQLDPFFAPVPRSMWSCDRPGVFVPLTMLITPQA